MKQASKIPICIVRLCNHTGCSGYMEFRKAVTYELANDAYEASLEQLSRIHIQKPGQTSGKAYKTSSQI